VLTTTGDIQTQQNDSDQQDEELPGKLVIKKVLIEWVLVYFLLCVNLKFYIYYAL